MDDFGLTGVIVAGLVLWFSLWLFVFLPARMARDRNRSPMIWVLISLVGSPLLAMLLLIALGPDDATGRRY